MFQAWGLKRKEKMENLKTSSEKIFNVQITENKPSCNNCKKYGDKSNPCLKGTRVTLDNKKLQGNWMVVFYLHHGRGRFGDPGSWEWYGKWLKPYINGMKQKPTPHHLQNPKWPPGGPKMLRLESALTSSLGVWWVVDLCYLIFQQS